MKLRDLPTELKKRGNDSLEMMHWHPDHSLPDLWVGFVFGLLDRGDITGSEALGFCLELEAAGAGNTEWFIALKQKSHEKSKLGE